MCEEKNICIKKRKELYADKEEPDTKYRITYEVVNTRFDKVEITENTKNILYWRNRSIVMSSDFYGNEKDFEKSVKEIAEKVDIGDLKPDSDLKDHIVELKKSPDELEKP